MAQPTDRQSLENQMEKEGRLPPGQSLTKKFPVLHYGSIPPFDPQTWSFRIWGEVEEEISWSWEEFSQFPQTEIQLDIHCVTRWSKFDTHWKGSIHPIPDRSQFDQTQTRSCIYLAAR